MEFEREFGKLDEDELHRLGHLIELRNYTAHEWEHFWVAIREKLDIPRDFAVQALEDGRVVGNKEEL